MADGLALPYFFLPGMEPRTDPECPLASKDKEKTVKVLILSQAALETRPEFLRVDRDLAQNLWQAMDDGFKKNKEKILVALVKKLARPGIAPYTATKGAIRNLTRGMCTDWAKYGLQVNAIAPGYFKTPLNQALVDNPEFSAWLEKRTPAARWGNVEELVGAAVFLSGEASSFVNGHTLYVDGGITASL